MSNKKPKFPFKWKCWYCGGYHMVTLKDFIVPALINVVLLVILILRSCGAN